jgi:hypothetical protein
MNSRNDKLNYIKSLIREQLQTQLKRKKGFLHEMLDTEPKSEVKFIQSENGGSLFLTNISKFKNLNLKGFANFEGANSYTNKNVFDIEIVIKLNDTSVKLTLNDFMIKVTDDTIDVNFKNQEITGNINVIYPKGIKITHDIRPISSSKYGFGR